MSKILIDIPDKFHYTTTLEVRISDINYGNHLANDTIATYINEARVNFLRSLGYADELNIDGLGIIMCDSALIFKSEGYFGDQINIDTTVQNMNRSGFDFVFRLYNVTQGKVLALGKTGMLFFDYKEKKVKSIPERFRNYFE